MTICNSMISIGRGVIGALRNGSREIHAKRFASSVKVAVVGSGPAGFYTVQELLRSDQKRFSVDIIEKSPVPFGLVRYGVAPDHPEVKNCISTFEEIASRPNVRFYGNVTVGQDVRIEELLGRYHVVVLAHGAGSDKKLGIVGEEARGCHPSGAFVGWFNGVPEFRDLNPDLTTSDTIPIIGHGNVALDCARILSAPLDHLATTDISSHAVDCLRRRRVKHVNLYGRRGIMQFQGTIKEVREFTKLDGIHLSIDSENVNDIRNIISTVPRPKKRLTELLLKYARHSTPLSPSDISVSFKFGWSPIEILTNTDDTVTGLRLRRNLISGDMMSPVITPTDVTVELPCSTIITSIGYNVVSLPGVPFCHRTNRIPEKYSRVLDNGNPVKGLYASGWARRGSDGVMATTITDSANTASTILEDLHQDLRTVTDGDVHQILQERDVKFVSFEDWKKLDMIEQEKGKTHGKIREKIADYDEMLSKIK